MHSAPYTIPDTNPLNKADFATIRERFIKIGARVIEHIARPATQRSLETGEGLWFACRAGLREAFTAVWDGGLRSKPATAEIRINARLAAVTTVQKCTEIVRSA